MPETRETVTDDRPTIQDVLKWRDLAAMRIATYIPPGADRTEAVAAIEAVHKLAELARSGLDAPQPAELRWAIRNDPVAYAAYNHGRLAAQSSP